MNIAIPILIGVILSFTSYAVFASEVCLRGCPIGAAQSNQVVSRPIYILSNNPATKFADWVAYRVTTKTIGTTQVRRWKADPKLDPDSTLAPRDYKNVSSIEMERGHQAPLASLTGTKTWPTANYLSNITPQASDLNQGSWLRLEDAERKLAKTKSSLVVYSITGPLYEKNMKPLPNATKQHRVPSGYWKIVAMEDSGQVRTAGFVFEQGEAKGHSYCSGLVQISEIERRAKLTFFPDLNSSQHDKIAAGPGSLAMMLGCKSKSFS